MSMRRTLSMMAATVALGGNARGQAEPKLPDDPSPVAWVSPPQSIPTATVPSPTLPPPAQVTTSVGTAGFLQPGLLLQGWFIADHADQTTSTFRVRRAEISVKGEIIAALVSYAVMIDPAKVLEFRDTSTAVTNQDPAPTDPSKPESVTTKQPVSALSVFQDFFITYQVPYLDVSIGQFKIPVSWEGYNSSSKLLFAERALVSKDFGDKRDLGIRLAKIFKYIGYSAGIFNGATLNNLDTNNAKDGALRLEVYPVQGLVLAGVLYGSIGQRGAPGTKDRYEADVRFERGPFLFQTEYIRAHDVGTSGTAVNARGFYAAVAWTFLDLLQPCLRVGHLDPDISKNLDPAADKGKDEVWQLDVGLNYYLRKQEAKLQLNYSRFQFDEKTANNEGVLAAQVAF
jgi:Phosphate-selective porin O and P